MPASDVYTWAKASSKPSYAWSEISGKPSTFAPSSHSHTWSSITNKPSTYTPSAHNHSWGEISSIPSTFTPSSHTHDDRYYTEAEINNILNEKLRWKYVESTELQNTIIGVSININLYNDFYVEIAIQADNINNIFPIMFTKDITEWGNTRYLASGCFSYQNANGANSAYVSLGSDSNKIWLNGLNINGADYKTRSVFWLWAR